MTKVEQKRRKMKELQDKLKGLSSRASKRRITYRNDTPTHTSIDIPSSRKEERTERRKRTHQPG